MYAMYEQKLDIMILNFRLGIGSVRLHFTKPGGDGKCRLSSQLKKQKS